MRTLLTIFFVLSVAIVSAQVKTATITEYNYDQKMSLVESQVARLDELVSKSINFEFTRDGSVKNLASFQSFLANVENLKNTLRGLYETQTILTYYMIDVPSYQDWQGTTKTRDYVRDSTQTTGIQFEYAEVYNRIEAIKVRAQTEPDILELKEYAELVAKREELMVILQQLSQ